jgi:hypothetical protein
MLSKLFQNKAVPQAMRGFSTANSGTFQQRWMQINKEVSIGGGQQRIDKHHK